VSETFVALGQEDPEAAARLKPGDTARVARALEVVRSTGRPLSAWQRQRHGGILMSMDIRAGVVLRSREELAERASRRLDAMLGGGAIEEVSGLLARALPADRPVLRALGVREISALIAGEISLAEAHAAIIKATIAYQKRQLTWARGRQAGWSRLDPESNIALDDLALLTAAP
jgi:tRNA dimethylallyltransferase